MSSLALPVIMSFINNDGESTTEQGEFRLEVGGASPGKHAQELGASASVSALFQLK